MQTIFNTQLVFPGRARLGGGAFAILGVLIAWPVVAATPSIRMTHEPGRSPVVDLIVESASDRASAEEWAERFKLYVATDQQAADEPAVLGTYQAISSGVRFTPRYPLQPGLRYRAEYRAGDGAILDEVFQVAERPPMAATEVAVVYPTASELPENQLKFYLHFTAPMGRGEAYDHLRLLDEAGDDLDLPFLEIGEELWDPSGKRLTLLLDPARVKRGLKPREEQGPVLEAGRRYSLVVDRRWRDAAGRSLAGEFRKRFSVGRPDELSPDPRRWQLSSPAAGSREPLMVRFGESLDQALLERTLWLTDAGGEPLEGKAEIGQQETNWSFVPRRPWQPGRYRLMAETILEDLAGNSIARKFEVERTRPVPKEDAEPAIVEFTVSNDQ